MKLLFLATASLGLFWASSVRAETLTTTFDSDLEGWTASGGLLSFNNTGGNPGGFLSLEDNVDDFMTVFAPSDYQGDLSRFLGGRLAFDARNLNGSSPNLISSPLFGTVTISGSSATASRLLGGTDEPPASGEWVTYSSQLDPLLWSGDLEAALSNVAQISVVLESNETVPAEFNGFDNFSVTSAPDPVSAPEPSAILGSVVALGIGAMHGKKRLRH